MGENEHPLRRWRAKYNLSIEALAKAAGLSDRTILRAEQWHAIRPSSRELIRACFSELAGYSVTTQQLGLIEGDEESPPETIWEIEAMNKLRRDLVTQAAAITGLTLVLPTQIDLDRIAHALTTPSNMDEKTLTYFTQLNERCWHLTNGSEIATIETLLPNYIPQLATIARQASTHQEPIAHLTAQGYLLGGLVALDQLDYAAMKKYSERAVEYSTLAKDYNLHAAALKQQATMYLIMKEPYKALLTYQQALPFMKHISPLLRSRIYQGLADASARCGYDAEAERYLGLAHESFPFSDWEQDPSFLYADSGLSVLWMYDGLTHLHLDHPSQALEAFLKVDGLAPKIEIGQLTQLEFLNLQAQAAVALRDQEQSRCYIEAAVAKANSLKCKWGRTEALDIYQDMRLLWPKEQQIRVLGQIFHN